MRLAILYFIFLSTFSFSQKNNCNKNVPFFLSRDPQKLSKYLIRNIETDEEKICVIYDWITHHIKYDVKKWRSFDYSHVSTKKILRKRKAVCEGYSILFSELCKDAGIKNVLVTGYSKNFDTDIVDNFYLDDHSWNAACIDGRWKLFDATWDAGYIKFFKRTWLGYIIRIVTLGTRDQYKFKPHFKKHPEKNYYASNGTSFKTDHLPVNPIWQTNDTVLEVKQYKNDSSFYFRDYKKENPQSFKSSEAELKREVYYHQDDDEKIIADGFIGNSCNKKNQFGIANAYFTMGRKESKKLDLAADTSKNRKIAATVFSLLDKSILHYDSNAYYLNIQRNELEAANSLKNKILNIQNGNLISTSKKVLSSAAAGVARTFRAKTGFKKLIRANNKKIRKVWRDQSYYKINPSKLPRAADSILLVHALKIVDDSITHQHDKLNTLYIALDSSFKKTIDTIIAHNFISLTIRGAELAVIDERLHYNDDLDYQIRVIKDSLLLYKFKNDSTLFRNIIFLPVNLLEKTKQIKTEINKQHNLIRTKLKLQKELKRVSMENNMLEKKYEDDIETMQTEFGLCEAQLNKWINRCALLKKDNKAIKKSARKEIKYYRSERALENALFRARAQRNSQYIKSYLRLNSINKNETQKERKKTESFLKLLAKKK